MSKVKFILGEAGTAKTTYLIKIIECIASGTKGDEELSKSKKIACLAFTHSAVNNMKSKTDNQKNITFKTIHSFLGIVPNSNGGYIRNKRCCNFDYDVIIVDEFTLIPLDIFNLLLSETVDRVEKIVIAGDLLQLPPPDSYEFVNEELFKEDRFNTVETDILTAIKIAKHLSQTAFNSDWFKNSNKMILQKNFRNGSNVKKILDSSLAIGDCRKSQSDFCEDFENFEIVDLKNVIKLVNDGYIVISSKYCLLKKIMKKIKITNGINSPIGLIDSKQELYLTENIDSNFSNGDVVKVVGVYDEEIEILKNENEKQNIKLKIKPNSENIYPLMPLNFYTVHKAQGKTFEKIVVILDDMFELSMLYTAITRAKDDVKFVCFNQTKAFKEIKEQNKAFNLLKQILYINN